MSAPVATRELLSLAGQVAVVTGGASGIGLATAHRFAEAGASVIVIDVLAEAAERAAAGLAGPGRHISVALDITAPDAAAAAAARCVESHGRIDILVNNAGMYPLEPLLSATEATLDRTYALNVRATILFSQAFAGVMIEGGRGGRIINLASIEAYHPAATGLSGYAATKGAIVSFTRHSAMELAGAGIRVNAIAPGPVLTEGLADFGAGTAGTDRGQALVEQFGGRIPLGRLAEPDDIAKTALFFASAAADYITGTTLLVDGGNILS